MGQEIGTDGPHVLRTRLECEVTSLWSQVIGQDSAVLSTRLARLSPGSLNNCNLFSDEKNKSPTLSTRESLRNKVLAFVCFFCQGAR